MKCPVCSTVELAAVMTTNSVLVDQCPECGGIWLDKGEIFHFTGTPSYLSAAINEALLKKTVSGRLCPKTGQPMTSLALFDMINVEYCEKTQGFWLDRGELEKLPCCDRKKLDIRMAPRDEEDSGDSTVSQEDSGERYKRFEAIRSRTASLSNLLLPSVFTVTGLYALLTLVLIFASLYLRMPLKTVLITGLLVAALQFVFGPFLMDLTLRWLYRCAWVDRNQLPGHLNAFIAKVCSEKRMAYPRIGIIEDGAPQAFTYGHTPSDARMVFSRGLMTLLEPEELEAVAAHELGHIKHWDMLLMTAAGLVPLIFYYIYRSLIRSSRSRGNSKGKGGAMMVAIVSYVLYIVSEYIVLWFSRIREYFADRFSGEVTRNPNALASALVKIGYGLAGKMPVKSGKEPERTSGMEAIRPMGIFDYRTASCMAISAYNPGMGGEIDKEKLKSAMFWDKWNPWARVFEINSTHPLIANRIESLTEQAVSLNQKPFIVFDRRRPESYWDEFVIDLVVMYLPWTLFLVSGFLMAPYLKNSPTKFFAVVSFTFGIGYLINVLFNYADLTGRDITIAGLLKKIKVSGIRPVGCRVSGTIVGRGVPGLVFSEDFVLKDETGIIFLDYNQPIPLWNLFFGLLRAGKFTGENVTVTGWYRRAPVPYIEIRTLTDSSGKTRRCYTYPAKLFLALALIATGCVLLFLAFSKGL